MSGVEVEHTVTVPAVEPLIRLPLYGAENVADGRPKAFAVRLSAVFAVTPNWLDVERAAMLHLYGGELVTTGMPYEEALDLFAPEEP